MSFGFKGLNHRVHLITAQEQLACTLGRERGWKNMLDRFFWGRIPAASWCRNTPYSFILNDSVSDLF
jgi:hypothetical protein